MHEYALTLEIIKIAEKHAKEAGARKVRQIMLVVGDDAGYCGDSVQMYFDVIAKNTMCNEAKIDIERIKPMMKCTVCGKLFERSINYFYCDLCKGAGKPTDIGKEFYIKFIEVED